MATTSDSTKQQWHPSLQWNMKDTAPAHGSDPTFQVRSEYLPTYLPTVTVTVTVTYR